MKPVTGLLYSQIGYDLGQGMRAIIRGPEDALLTASGRFTVCRAGSDAVVLEGPVSYWGKLWGSSWWVADFSGLAVEGQYTLHIHDARGERFSSEAIEVGRGLLWKRTWKQASIEQAERRARLAMNRIGWQDCGASWQEANSHAAYVIGFTDLLEFVPERLGTEERKRLEAQVINGCEYLALLQKRAVELGHPEGAMSHQKPKFEEIVLPANVAKAAVVFARAARLLSDAHAEKKQEYLQRAQKAFEWLRTAKPFGQQGFSPVAHGAPANFKVPADEFMTRDLLMMNWAAFELAQAGLEEYQQDAVALAEKVMRRQVPQDRKEGEFYGHFHTFDSADITEKAWIHNLDKGVIGTDAGGHFPYYLVPLLRMCKAWPNHPDQARWQQTIRNFAYGYFLPACRKSPFLILPLGYFQGVGLLYFSGLWHGMNVAYCLGARLALEFERFFNDPAFGDIAVGNLQWIAGLNAGVTAEGLYAAHMWSMDVPEGAAVPVSMIHGIGRRCAGTWLNVRGSICNGFSTGDQFRFDVTPSLESDGPHTFTDEDWITHAGGWLSALAWL